MAQTGPAAARLFAVGADHRSSRAALRDRLFIGEAEMPGFFADLRGAGIGQAIVLSTCDRVEVEGAHHDPGAAVEAVIGLFAARAGLDTVAIREQLVVRVEAAALRHMFAVAAALESQVLGEPQVLGQVKEAHRRAHAAALTGPELDGALQAAYGAAKRVRTETEIGQRPVSLASAAVALAREVHGDLGRCSGLLVGLGEMGELLVEHLAAAGLKQLSVTAPNAARADDLARHLASHTAPFDDLAIALAHADILVTAAGTGRHLVSEAMMREALRRRRNRAVFIIDLGVPADVEPGSNAWTECFAMILTISSGWR